MNDTAVQKFLKLFRASPLSFVQRKNVAAPDPKTGKRPAEYVTVKSTLRPFDVRQHLSAKVCVVAKPVFTDGTCQWAVIDIDLYGADDFAKLEAGVKRALLPLHCFKSKSGGAHAFAFFKKPVSAAEARALLANWAAQLGHPNAEIFPKQNQIDGSNLGNGIALPFFGDAAGFTCFRPEYCPPPNGTAPPPIHEPQHAPPHDFLGIPIPQGINLQQVLATKLNLNVRHAGGQTWFDYHALRGFHGQPQSCLIQGSVHHAQLRNPRQCSFVEYGGKFAHRCFDTDCQATGGEGEESKTRRAVRTLGLESVLLGTAKNGKVVDAQLVTETFDQIRAKEIAWLWPERIPAAKLTIFSGNPDQGKTTALLDIIARVTTGTEWPDHSKNTHPSAHVLMASAEDDPADTLKPRLIAAGANMEHIHLLKCVRLEKDAKRDERMLALDTDLDLIEAALKQHPEIQFVGIDPVTSYLGRANVNREQEVRAVLVPIKELAERTGVTFLCTGHFNKRGDVSAIHRVGGAVAMTGVARAVWLFTQNPENEDEHLMLLVKGNLTKMRSGMKYRIVEKSLMLSDEKTTVKVGVPIINWLGESDVKADAVLDRTQAKERGKRTRAKNFLLEFLADGEKESEEIFAEAKKQHIGRSTLFVVKDELSIGAIRLNKRWWWCLPVKTPQ